MKLGMAHVEARSQYADYRKRLDARAVLEHYGAQNCREETNKDGTTEIIHSCLLDRVEPHHAHGDGNPSAACNVDKKLYCCYSYWSGDLFQLIQKLEGHGAIEDITPIVGQFLSGVTDDSDTWKATVDKGWAAVLAEGFVQEPPTYSDRILAPWAFVHPYLAKRGIDADTASRLHIGWDERVNRITIPHYWNGQLVGWQTRAIPGMDKSVHPPVAFDWPGTVPEQPKYKSNSGFPKSETLYGYDNAVGFDRLIVVESPFSVIKAVALGIPGVVATFGAKVSDIQIALLRQFSRVYVWMDDDTPGRVAERRLVNYLHRRTRVDVVRPDVGRDLADCCDIDEVDRKLGSSEPAVLALVRYGKEGKLR